MLTTLPQSVQIKILRLLRANDFLGAKTIYDQWRPQQAATSASFLREGLRFSAYPSRPKEESSIL